MGSGKQEQHGEQVRVRAFLTTGDTEGIEGIWAWVAVLIQSVGPLRRLLSRRGQSILGGGWGGCRYKRTAGNT